DVRVTYTDPDGINGAATVVTTPASITLPVWSTLAGTAAVTQATTTSLDVSMPYTGDVNANNSAKVEYCDQAACTWRDVVIDDALTITDSGTEFTVTITGLTTGTTYDVRTTYIDPETVSSGTNPQTPSLTLTNFPTAAGIATAVKSVATANTAIDVSMPYTGDTNNNSTYTVDYKLSSSGTWVNWVTGATNTPSPYTTTITGLIDGETYDVQATYVDDVDTVTTNPAVQPVPNIALDQYRTTVDTVTLSQATEQSILVTMPYSGDVNGNNTYSVSYQANCAGGYAPWVTAVDPEVTPSTTIPNLAKGSCTDVEVTWNDTDGLIGTSPQTPQYILVQNSTQTSTATAVQATDTSINVSMPYTADEDTNNTYTVDYEMACPHTNTWTNHVFEAGNVDRPNPYTTTIPGLTPGQCYTVKMAYNDTGGVFGASPQYVERTLAINNTIADVATATAATVSSIDVSMPYSGDVNNTSTYTVEYCVTSSCSYIPWVTGAANAPSPYSTTITGLTGGETYNVRVTYLDTTDSVLAGAGAVQQTFSNIALSSNDTTVVEATAVAVSETSIDV
ncbi:MAG: hypothetical protein KAJ19_14035, partial [Gammaproteobacteria bacterium]|nr:hypothetical protein [Gammaproteobacteria bacterium]